MVSKDTLPTSAETFERLQDALGERSPLGVAGDIDAHVRAVVREMLAENAPPAAKPEMSDFETKLAEAEALIAAGIPTHWGKPFEDVVAIAREVVAEKDAEIARLEAAYHSETILSNALAGALRERGYEHVWDVGTQRLTVTAVESCRECGEPPQSMNHRGSTGHQYFGPVS